MDSWEAFPEDYQCSVSTIRPGNKQNVESTGGIHLRGKNNGDVKFFFMYGNNLNRIPKGIDKYFSNLAGIRLDEVGLQAISAGDLKAFPNLIHFSAPNNKLTSIPGDLFKFTLKLKHISFHNNLITNVGENLLTNLQELKGVYFEANFCINLNADTPEGITSLEIQLQNCRTVKSKNIAIPATRRTLIEPPEISENCDKEKVQKFLEAFMNRNLRENKVNLTGNSQLADELESTKFQLDSANKEILDLNLQILAKNNKIVADGEKIKRLEKKIEELRRN